MKTKKNCWEFMKCGRESGGANAKKLGICPAATEERLNGVHGGKNAGRTWWVVVGTFCEGEPQGTFAQRYDTCGKCDFYKFVLQEEGAQHFELVATLLERLK